MQIFLEAEKIFHIGAFNVTNTYLTSLLVVMVLSVLAFLFSKKIKQVPGKIQNLVEYIIETLFEFFEKVFDDKERTKKFFPFIATFFLFILFSNWLGIFPGMGTIGIYEEHNGKEILVPFFRSVNSDINMTLALAVISVLMTDAGPPQAFFYRNRRDCNVGFFGLARVPSPYGIYPRFWEKEFSVSDAGP